ncbi:MAG: S8 family serine peptidase [Deltaproteobacteria bacterium]|nr:S8 family serine peptidase [Deltaproteobacteria bacterium]
MVIVSIRPGPSKTFSLLSLPGLLEQVKEERMNVLQQVKNARVIPVITWKTLPSFAALVDEQGLLALQSLEMVEKIDLDVSGRGGLVQSVPMIGADQVHQQGYTGKGVTAAILDTGIDTHHPDLAPGLVAEHCFCLGSGAAGCCPSGAVEQDGRGSAEDDNGHGTNVAGIVAGRGGIAPAGVAPGADIVAIKVIDKNNRFKSITQVISALDWIVTNRPEVKVINMSLGTDALYKGACDKETSWTLSLSRLAERLKSRGTMIFASSMNNGSADSLAAPACIESIISVGAVYDSNIGKFTCARCTDAVTAPDMVTCFSNTGPGLDLLAPGAPITSTGRASSISTYYGTSQASPHAAGAAALLIQAVPKAGPEDIEQALKDSGKPVTDPKNNLTFPRINVAAALDLLASKFEMEQSGDSAEADADQDSFDQADAQIDNQETGLDGSGEADADQDSFDQADAQIDNQETSLDGSGEQDADQDSFDQADAQIDNQETGFDGSGEQDAGRDNIPGHNWPTNTGAGSGCGCQGYRRTGNTSLSNFLVIPILGFLLLLLVIRSRQPY